MGTILFLPFWSVFSLSCLMTHARTSRTMPSREVRADPALNLNLQGKHLISSVEYRNHVNYRSFVHILIKMKMFPSVIFWESFFFFLKKNTNRYQTLSNILFIYVIMGFPPTPDFEISNMLSIPGVNFTWLYL